MDFSVRQTKIINMLKHTSPMTGEMIAAKLGLGVPTIRADLRLLTTLEVLVARPKVGYLYQGDQLINMNYDDLYNIPIGSILLPPTKINDDTSLQEAVTKLFLEDVGSLYVVDDQQQMVGLISRKDLLRASFNNANPDNVLASVVMTRMPNIVITTPDTTVMEAGELLLKHQVDSLPVFESRNGRNVIGKITKNRIFEHFIRIGKK